MAGGTFPASVPSYAATVGGENANTAGSGTGLSPLLNNFETDVTALATKVGTGSSVAAANQVLVGTGAGTSAWQGLTSAQLAAIVSDETGTGALVFGSSPTIVTPTIASFTNATHNHSNNAGGGQLTGSTALANSTVTADKLSTGAQTAAVATAESTSSTSFVDLATTGPTVTVTIGANGLALVCLGANMANSVASGNGASTSFVVSGANTIAAGTVPYIIFYQTWTAGALGEFGRTWVISGLTPGSTTFKTQYAAFSGGTGTWKNRSIAVVPL